MRDEIGKTYEDADVSCDVDDVVYVGTDVTPQVNKDRGSAIKSDVRGDSNSVTISVTINHAPR